MTSKYVMDHDPNFTSTYSYDADKGTYARTVNAYVTVDKSNEKQVGSVQCACI